MARKRMIAPAFFKHADLYDAEVASGLPLRLAFAGLWTVADRRGVFQWSRSLKPDVLPYDQCDMLAVLEALAAHGFVQKYEVDGKWYGMVPTLGKHQHFHKDERASALPAPGEAGASTGPAPGQRALSTAPNGRLTASDIRHTETTSKASSPRRAAVTDASADAAFDTLWASYPKRAGGNPRGPALKAYRARLAAGVSHDDMAAGLARYTAYCVATGKVGTEYVKQAATFFGPAEEAWKELWAVPIAAASRRTNGASPTEAAAKAHATAVSLEDRYQADAHRAGVRWAHEHPEDFEKIKATVERSYAGNVSVWTAAAIKVELTQKCAREAGFPPFVEWRAADGASA